MKPTLYSIWGTEECPNVLKEGAEPPTLANGTRFPDSQVVYGQFLAPTYDDAEAVYNQLREADWS